MRKEAEMVILRLTVLLDPNTGKLPGTPSELEKTKLKAPIPSPTFDARTSKSPQTPITTTHIYKDGSILIGCFTGNQLYFHVINHPADRDNPHIVSDKSHSDLTVYYTRAGDGTVSFAYERSRESEPTPYASKSNIPLYDDRVSDAFELFDSHHLG
ncbi:hypothetical protein FWD07_02515 [Candidatus Saccharibacteria bacterium]|nr:hypothetical protein [Candidatus Saccharibacteria bacterium]